MEIIKFILSIPILLIFYKDGTKKFDNIYNYYLIVSDFKISENKKIIKCITSILISIDLTIAIGILFPSTKRIISICGILFEVFYLFIMIKNYNKGFKHGCKCYIINATDEVELIDIMKIMLIIFIFICILII